MKRLFPLLLCCLCGTGVFAQSDSNTRVIELTVTLDPTKIEYYYDEETGGYAVDYHGSADETLEGAYESGEPDIPFMEKVIPIKESEKFISMTYSFTETTLMENFDFIPVPRLIPSGTTANASKKSISYPKEIYPDENVRYVTTSTLPSGKNIYLIIVPFRYDAQKHLLSLLDIKLSVIVKNQATAGPQNCQINGIYYSITTQDDGTRTATVTNAIGGSDINFNRATMYSGDVIIPEAIIFEGEEIPVTRIQSGAFMYCDSLKSVVIPHSVECIESSTFSHCTFLKSVSLPEGLHSIDSQAFYSCLQLSSINIPSSVSCIGEMAFYGCKALTSLTITDAVTDFGDNAFENSGIAAIMFSKSAVIGKDVLLHCTNISHIVVEEGHPEYDSRGSCNALIETATGTLVRGCNTTRIPADIRAIGDYAFEGCSELTSVEIPEGCSSIGNGAFAGCRALDGIKLPESLISMGERTFMECTSLSSIAIPATLTSIPQSAFFDCQSLKYVSLPATVTTIGDGAFSQCGFEAIAIPSRVDSIGKFAFNGCAQLKSIALPDELTCIDIATFENCPQLQSIVLPENLKEIKQQAFSNDNNIKVVTAKMRQPMPFKETGINITQPATLYIPEGTREAYAQKNWLSSFTDVVEIHESEETYRLFIEEGKVWKVGWPGLDNEIYYLDTYFFQGDTIIDNRICKKTMCKTEWKDRERPVQVNYAGALFEEGRRVYLVHPGSLSFVLLYDFASPVGTTIDFYDNQDHGPWSCLISKKYTSTDSFFHGLVTEISINEDGHLYTYGEWREGVGYNCLQNVYDLNKTTSKETLLSCTVGDEVLYFNPSYIDDISQPIDPGVKKQWLDFTHVVKPRPKSPRHASASEDDTASDEAEEPETLTGEYSTKELFVSLKTLAGAYTISLTDAVGKEVYRKEVQTSNVVALNTDLTKYAAGQYTLTVENSEEQYTASLSLPLINDAVRDLLDNQSNNTQSVNGKWLDLSGRRLRSTPNKRGLYIVGGRKVIIK